MVEPEREDRVAGLEQREVRRHVRRRARMRLHVRVLGAEQLLRAVDRELLDLVHDLAAAVVALAGIALGVLVRRHRADGLEHARPGEVLGRDQLDLAALALELPAEQPGDVRVDLLQARGAEPVERFLGDGHCRSSLARDASMLEHRRDDPERLVRGDGSSRRTRASAPVTSITVEGVPGSVPPSRSARGGGAQFSGDVGEPARVGDRPGDSRSSRRARRHGRATPPPRPSAREPGRRSSRAASRRARGKRPAGFGTISV